MGTVLADITLENNGDLTMAQRRKLDPDQVRRVEVSAVVDTGADTLIINETIRDQLGLSVEEQRFGEFPDGRGTSFDLCEPVKILFRNRTATCRPMVVPQNKEILLGAIPLEEMDVVVNPRHQALELPAERPDLARIKLYTVLSKPAQKSKN
jgi:clan AA aspartic protease